MRIGKPTRLERDVHKKIVQQHAQTWMDERGYAPASEEWIKRAEAEQREYEQLVESGEIPLRPARFDFEEDA